MFLPHFDITCDLQCTNFTEQKHSEMESINFVIFSLTITRHVLFLPQNKAGGQMPMAMDLHCDHLVLYQAGVKYVL